MHLKSYRYPLLLLLLSVAGCKKKTNEPEVVSAFAAPVGYPVTPLIEETSGIADSKANGGHLWIQEDSGNPPELTLVSHAGAVVKKVHLKGAVNRDWEDMALAGDQLYIADIGDNNKAYGEYSIYQLTEPLAAADTVSSFQVIRFRYPDGAYDAEALLVDAATKDIYLITKQDAPSRVYRLAYPYSYTQQNEAAYVGSLAYSGVVSAALSPDQKNILVKTYTDIYLYAQKAANDNPAAVLSGTGTKLAYKLEPQGEALAFAQDGSGFFTLSEKGLANSVQLYFYRKK